MWLADLMRRLLALRGARPQVGAPRPGKRTVLGFERLETRDVPSGTWRPLANLAPGAGAAQLKLLPDGEVMVQAGGSIGPAQVTSQWSRLSPDAHGDYINGTFASATSNECRQARLRFEPSAER
jgi:hypothetical protein